MSRTSHTTQLSSNYDLHTSEASSFFASSFLRLIAGPIRLSDAAAKTAPNAAATKAATEPLLRKQRLRHGDARCD